MTAGTAAAGAMATLCAAGAASLALDVLRRPPGLRWDATAPSPWTVRLTTGAAAVLVLTGALAAVGAL